MTKEARAFIRDDEEAVSCGEEAVFFCDNCGEGVFPGGDYTEVLPGRSLPLLRYCGDCAEERATLRDHLEMVGIRTRSGKA